MIARIKDAIHALLDVPLVHLMDKNVKLAKTAFIRMVMDVK